MADLRFNTEMGGYRAIYTKLWDDERVITLQPIEKLVYLFILTGPHTTSVPGFYPLRAGQIAGHLDITRDEAETSLANLKRAGLIDYDAVAIITPKFTKYHRPGNPNIAKGWAKILSTMPKSRVMCDWIEALDLWYQQHAKARRPEIRNFPDCSDMGNAAGIKPVSLPKEGEGEGEEEGYSESSITSESSGISLPSPTSAAPVAQPALAGGGEVGAEMWAAWVADMEAKARALGTPPDVFTSLAMRAMQEFQVYYDQTTSNGRMTDKRIQQFVKRVKRVDPVCAMIGMEHYIDGHGGRKPWNYCAKIITNQLQLSDKERMADNARHRKRFRTDGVWAEITQALAERKAEPA